MNPSGSRERGVDIIIPDIARELEMSVCNVCAGSRRNREHEAERLVGDQDFFKFRHPQTWVTRMETLSFTVIQKHCREARMSVVVNVYRHMVEVAEREGFEPSVPVVTSTAV